LKLKCADQAEEIEELRSTLDGLERERDYYFRKLRNVEILCTTLQAKSDPSLNVPGIIEEITGILYAEDDHLDSADGPPEENAAPERSGEVPQLPGIEVA